MKQPLIDDRENVLKTLAFYFPEPKSPDSADIIVRETAAELAALAIQCRKDQFTALNQMQRNLIRQI